MTTTLFTMTTSKKQFGSQASAHLTSADTPWSRSAAAGGTVVAFSSGESAGYGLRAGHASFTAADRLLRHRPAIYRAR